MSEAAGAQAEPGTTEASLAEQIVRVPVMGDQITGVQSAASGSGDEQRGDFDTGAVIAPPVLLMFTTLARQNRRSWCLQVRPRWAESSIPRRAR